MALCAENCCEEPVSVGYGRGEGERERGGGKEREGRGEGEREVWGIVNCTEMCACY